ncbi:hypothetical protein CRG98_020534 [Punica granatum]|uniref:Uncharacterized protein n=1 Tax=Punica granatum TaxID=22663 RepID=A0A2I0JRZ7_PUNGR|nr:hypothetical protein CRG98_020534 [Punica granatum]
MAEGGLGLPPLVGGVTMQTTFAASELGHALSVRVVAWDPCAKKGPHARDLKSCDLMDCSTFPKGCVAGTRERMSRHLSFYDSEVEGG